LLSRQSSAHDGSITAVPWNKLNPAVALHTLPHVTMLHLCCIAVVLQLIDFGLSKHLESVATLGVGTPDYMPPEMVRSQVRAQQRSQQMRAAAAAGAGSLSPHGEKAPPYDAKKVDAWAMGVLLYLLVTGTYPFEVSSVSEQFQTPFSGFQVKANGLSMQASGPAVIALPSHGLLLS
jgi:serine/threonine protein kinase